MVGRSGEARAVKRISDGGTVSEAAANWLARKKKRTRSGSSRRVARNRLGEAGKKLACQKAQRRYLDQAGEPKESERGAKKKYADAVLRQVMGASVGG